MLLTTFKSVGTGNCKAALVVSMIAPRWGRVDKGGRLEQFHLSCFSIVGSCNEPGIDDWIVYADLDLDSHAGLLLGQFENQFPTMFAFFAGVDWLMMSDQFSSPICQSYLKHMFPCIFRFYSTCSGGLLLVSTDNPPTFIPQEVALNFARQHGGIAANELPDIVNFITQVPTSFG